MRPTLSPETAPPAAAAPTPQPPGPGLPAAAALIPEVQDLRRTLLESGLEAEPRLAEVPPERRASARNLLQYLALRRGDLRDLQDRLAELGLSSLGRCENAVLHTLDAVQRALEVLAGRPAPAPGPGLLTPAEAAVRLEERTARLFGERRPARTTRILVTLPAEAAGSGPLLRRLIEAGMDAVRINCAHDGPEAWAAMVGALRRAEAEAGRRCRVLVDLAGPKLRTGPVAPGPAVRRLRPRRDALGRVLEPALLALVPAEEGEEHAGDAALRVSGAWLRGLRPRDRVRLSDARGRERLLEVVTVGRAGATLECERTCFVIPGLELRLRRAAGRPKAARLLPFPPPEGSLRLATGDLLDLTASLARGTPARRDARGRLRAPARIGCTLPEALAAARVGHAVWFDDGRLGGIVRQAGPERLRIEITQAPEGGGRLGADKGINLPDTDLPVRGLTEKDEADLAFVAAHADAVSLSFAADPADVHLLRRRLDERGAPHVGIVLKIETRRGFERLPELLLAGLSGPLLGVMIARGDLAVECGFERLAEVQEEILWLCEAAHVPAVWATQVLEGLAKSGRASRAEVTDAAMAERAECVMLNKGPHVVQAVRTLSDILGRMQAHQRKKRSLFRPLLVARSLLGASPAEPRP